MLVALALLELLTEAFELALCGAAATGAAFLNIAVIFLANNVRVFENLTTSLETTVNN